LKKEAFTLNKLKLGIPKGSLENATIELFRKSGWKIQVSSRNYFPDIDDKEMTCTLVRAQEMSRYVENGTLDVGLTGKDWIRENGSDVVVVSDLVYSKVSQKPARWVLVVKENSPIKKIEDLKGKKISTELVNFTRNYFAERNIPVEVEFSWGATEAKVVEELVDAIVEVTETGSTIRANGLRIVSELMQTNTQLIANKNAWKDPWKKEKIEQIALLLKGALQADGMVVLKMNIPKGKLRGVIDILPCLNAPTVSNLYQKDWFSVETVISEAKVRELIPRLQKLGAEGIIEFSLNKVI
jgi:ATP phosphoribosyltransferase